MRRYQGATDIPLNDTGAAQARSVAEGLAGVEFGRVISSPRIRAVKSAAIISGRLETEIEIVDALREGALGDWEGMLETEIISSFGESEYDEWRSHAGFIAPPGGETMFHVMARLYPYVEEWLEYSKERNLLAVGHQGGNAAVLMLVTGECGRDAAKNYRQRNGQVDVIDAALRKIASTKYFD